LPAVQRLKTTEAVRFTTNNEELANIWTGWPGKAHRNSWLNCLVKNGDCIEQYAGVAVIKVVCGSVIQKQGSFRISLKTGRHLKHKQAIKYDAFESEM